MSLSSSSGGDSSEEGNSESDFGKFEPISPSFFKRLSLSCKTISLIFGALSKAFFYIF